MSQETGRCKFFAQSSPCMQPSEDNKKTQNWACIYNRVLPKFLNALPTHTISIVFVSGSGVILKVTPKNWFMCRRNSILNQI
jgi:hypothetical protein